MKGKGFTLVELLAVIAIIGVISLITIPNIIKIRQDYLQKTYESRVRIIKNAALDWASDNLVNVPSDVPSECENNILCSARCSCLCKTIGSLIEEGYLSGSDDDNTVMKNPTNNENINSKNVCVRYDNNNVFTRKLIAILEE